MKRLILALLLVASVWVIAEPIYLRDAGVSPQLDRYLNNPIFPGNVKVTGVLTAPSAVLTGPVLKPTVEVSAANDVLTAAQSGSYLIYTAGQDITLPAATGSGAVFYIVDANAAAASDLKVTPDASGSINGDTAGEYIQCTTDADGTMATLIDAATNTWYAVYTQAAWTEE